MADNVMKAVQYRKYGGGAQCLEHVEVPIPHPNTNELLVKVKSVALNPADWKVQEGGLRPFLPRRFPFIPTTDIAGEVIKIGCGVNDFKLGDRIVTMLNLMKGGGLAEYAVVSAKEAVKLPSDFCYKAGASLPLSGLTALQTVRDIARIKLDNDGSNLDTKKMNLLVTAASGGVGHIAVQIAKLGGAHVTATCGARNILVVDELGADEVLDYKTPKGTSLNSPSGCKYDVVINCASSLPWWTFQSNLSPDGKVVVLNPDCRAFVRSVVNNLTCSKQDIIPFIFPSNNKEDLAILVELVSQGKVKVLTDSCYPLSQAQAAWEKIRGGHATGKVIINIDE